MLDRIKINITNHETIASITSIVLNSPKTSNVKHTPTGFTANYANLRVIARAKSLTIAGSITKFGLEYNSLNADKVTNIQNIQAIAGELNLPLSTPISELEFGFNIPVRHNPSTYLEAMEMAKGYAKYFGHTNKQRVFMKDTIYLRFYNKTEHFRGSLTVNTGIPFDLKVLRYEVRLLNLNVSPQRPDFTLASLQSCKVQNHLVALWAREFSKIIFESLKLPAIPLQSPKDVYAHLILKGIEAYGGLKNVFAIINAQMPKNYVYASRTKSKLTELYSDVNLSEECEFATELAQKVAFTACYYIAQQINASQAI
ncbi:hypothetical protein [Flaviaesturariibacter aridisoli]|uniref:Uncharacterized protein n=1 Tax=Flaviaesturariibacter aridisoli TaxID=2545761 RepID=A0A4R4E6X4_9BACT|nr:hypothetical protein [Flaviaesturariibacter aridisoli]TCZ73455.1 hypothetical protein E0486_05710 [Flaviaesturariibacter aridisoli]